VVWWPLGLRCNTVSFMCSVPFHRATRVVRPLERILLDNGIVRERSHNRPAAPEAMDVDSNDSDSESGVASKPSSSSAALKRVPSSTRNIHTTGTNARPRPGNSTGAEVDYHSIAAGPSVFPARQCFCSVCGYIGHYSCTRCGSKFCSIRCNENHKETRCFKFSM
jgi:hypothetical protein